MRATVAPRIPCAVSAAATNPVPIMPVRNRSKNRRAVFGCSHRLFDDHEATWKHAQARQATGIVFQLLSDTRRDLVPFRQHCVHYGWGGRRSHDRRILKCAREVKIVCAALAYDDTGAYSVYLVI